MDSEAESPAAGRWRFQDIEVESGAEGDPVREGLWGLGIGKGVARTSAPGRFSDQHELGWGAVWTPRAVHLSARGSGLILLRN